MSDARSLRKQFNRMLATLLVALAAAGAVTYAWYIYNANRHITDVKMAAGTGVTFLISNEYDGEYKTNAGLSFAGLLDPVSTDNVLNGFQKVTGFTGGTTQDSLFASMFGAAEHSDYYKTSLYLATNSAATDVYLSGIDFTEQDPANPISTALRVGLVAYAPGQGDTVAGQYVFEVSGEHNPQARYNTLDGKDASESEQDHLVLDSTRSDGATVHFDQLTSANFCDYNEDTGTVSLKEATTKICSLPAAAKTWLIIPMGIAAFVVFFAVFYFAIKKWDLKTPGREDDQEGELKIELANNDYTAMATIILEGLGGKENVVSIDHCITRLRLEVKDRLQVNEAKIKASGAAGVLRPGKTSVQVIIGPKVQFVYDEFKKLCK